MKIADLKESQPYLHEILTEMFRVVDADIDIDIKIDDWYYGYTWTQEQENEFNLWLVNYLKNSKAMKELSGFRTVNSYLRNRVAILFLLNYGWKTKIAIVNN